MFENFFKRIVVWRFSLFGLLIVFPLYGSPKEPKQNLTIVQNRLFTKSGKMQFSLLSGLQVGDPFLLNKAIGGQLGYSFNEVFTFRVLGWKYFVSASRALSELESYGRTANTVIPTYFVGGEIASTIIYGKVAYVEQSIFYFDLDLVLGGGLVGLDTSPKSGFLFGVNQRFYFTKRIGLNFSVKGLYHQELVQEKSRRDLLGKELGTRGAFSTVYFLGLDYYLQ